MKYAVTIGESQRTTEVVGDGVVLDGRSVRVHLEESAGVALARLSLNGAVRAMALRRDSDGWVVYWRGRVYRVDVVDERTGQIRAAAGKSRGHPGIGAVRAPMPGLVLRVEVKEGQVVEEGTGLAVLEAMKMENEIRAHGRARVAAIRVTDGEAVEKGAILIELEDAG